MYLYVSECNVHDTLFIYVDEARADVLKRENLMQVHIPLLSSNRFYAHCTRKGDTFYWSFP